jgi:AcrR family transcriptional regulator
LKLKVEQSKKSAATRRAQGDRRRESMELILDHAEALFAQSGFNGVTVNDVARSAEVDTALVRYYFGDKGALFAAVVDRRSGLVNETRLKAIEDYRASAGENFTLEGLIRAFTAPAFEMMQKDLGHRNYGAIIGYVNSSRAEFQRLMSRNFDEVSRVLIEDMKRLMPDAHEEDIYWGYHFLTGAFTFSLGQTGRIDGLSGGLCDSEDLQAISERLPITLAAGIQAMCEQRAQARKASER